MLQLLENDRYADVAPLIRASGMLGGFGWPMLRVVVGQRRYWRFLTVGFARHATRRFAEILGRRYCPTWLARRIVRVFYGR